MPDLKEALERLIRAWLRDAAQYQKQVDECREKRLPHAGMLSTAGTFRECAHDLKLALSAFPNLNPPTTPNPQQTTPTQ